MRARALLLGLALLSPPAIGQPFVDAATKWLKDNNIQLRQTFDGTSKDEEKPAAIFWVLRDSKVSGKNFVQVDLGLKVSEWELLTTASQSLILFPALEYHRDASAKDPVDKLGAKLAIEYRPMPAEAAAVVPLLLVSAGFDRDFEKQKTKGKGVAQLRPYSKIRFMPGNRWRRASNDDMKAGAIFGQYIPYVGLEYYQPQPAATSDHVWLFQARLYADYAPFATNESRGLELLVDYTYRRRINGPDAVAKEPYYFQIGVNWYFGKQNNFAIGWDYRRGYDPKEDLLFRERSTVGLKVKF